jgi:hypothetical protein
MKIYEEMTEQFLYRTVSPTKRHRYRVSAYLVKKLKGTNVVARIEPLGFINESLARHEIAMVGLQKNLVARGGWEETKSRNHVRIQVGMKNSGLENKKVVPRK